MAFRKAHACQLSTKSRCGESLTSRQIMSASRVSRAGTEARTSSGGSAGWQAAAPATAAQRHCGRRRARAQSPACAADVARRAQWHDTPAGRPQADVFCHTPALPSIYEPCSSAVLHCYALSHFLPIREGAQRVPIIAKGEYDQQGFSHLGTAARAPSSPQVHCVELCCCT